MGILHNVRSDYGAAIESLENSIDKNKDNVYAYLALGDALERQKELERAHQVFKDLNGLGVKVHGLKEKISYLEGTIAQNKKSEKIRLEREKEKEKAQQLRDQQDLARQAKEDARQAKLQDEKDRKSKHDEEKKAAQATKKADDDAAKVAADQKAAQLKLDKAAEAQKKKDDAAMKASAQPTKVKPAVVVEAPKTIVKEPEKKPVEEMKKDPISVETKPKPMVPDQKIEAVVDKEIEMIDTTKGKVEQVRIPSPKQKKDSPKREDLPKKVFPKKEPAKEMKVWTEWSYEEC